MAKSNLKSLVKSLEKVEADIQSLKNKPNQSGKGKRIESLKRGLKKIARVALPVVGVGLAALGAAKLHEANMLANQEQDERLRTPRFVGPPQNNSSALLVKKSGVLNEGAGDFLSLARQLRMQQQGRGVIQDFQNFREALRVVDDFKKARKSGKPSSLANAGARGLRLINKPQLAKALGVGADVLEKFGKGKGKEDLKMLEKELSAYQQDGNGKRLDALKSGLSKFAKIAIPIAALVAASKTEGAKNVRKFQTGKGCGCEGKCGCQKGNGIGKYLLPAAGAVLAGPLGALAGSKLQKGRGQIGGGIEGGIYAPRTSNVAVTSGYGYVRF